MKSKLLIAVATLSLVVTACGTSNNMAPKDGDKNQTAGDVTKIEHMHGVSYAQDGSSLFIATHEGLLTSKNGGASWSKVGKEDLDLMGFNVMPDGTMITSGHPGKGSNYPNPLGFMKSQDAGQTWTPVSMEGKIDFHILVPNSKQTNVLYGLNQMGEGSYGAGIYKSTDGGKNWAQIKPSGLPDDLHKVLSILSLSDNPDVLLAGVEEVGLLRSEDGGKTWKTYDKTRLLTAMQSIPNSNDILGYVITNNGNGIMISKDGGKSWDKLGLDLGKDAIDYISVNPKNTNEIMASSFENSVFVTKDGGKSWTPILEKGTPKK